MANYQGMMKIISIKNIADEVYEMILEGDGAKCISAPGQFINIKINDSLQPYLRRPMSVSDYSKNSITIVFKVIGEGTQILKDKKIGEELDCLLGFGNGFTLKQVKKAALIGGGLGTPPLYNLGKQLAKQGIEVVTVLGFASEKDIFYVEKFKEFSTVHVATMDGSVGIKGNVVDVIKEKGITFDQYYSCGAPLMLNALVQNYPENGQLSYEARMGCGFGACMGCSCKVKGAPYKRICVEGPVLESSEVIINE